jgi:[ribosomal protein S18]-alanine N-acetyltransferase
MSEWVIAPLRSAAELDEILAIERVSFTNPWTREMYLADLENSSVSHCYVARDETGTIGGFCSFWHVADEVHINNLAVAPERRNAGAGTALVREVMRAAARTGATRAILEVRRSNENARRLYERLGFELIGVRREYYTSPVEDALVLWRENLENT